MMTACLRVELGPRGYDIVIGGGVLGDAATHIAPLLHAKRVIIVTDAAVAKLYLAPLAAALEGAGIAQEAIILPAGERTKSFRHLERLLRALLKLAPDRRAMIVALGGGVVGDIAGFAASILLRGIDFIQVPTTLLAQVDSSVGGKTGINTRFGKNLIGTFHQPRLVLADVGTLATLPRRELLAGYAEVVKYGVLGNAAFFGWLEANGPKALAGDAGALAHIVRESCKAKADIVAQDERESGRRALLNFGHTFAHALEAQAGYGDTLLHGEAVAIGMALAMRMSVKKGLCSLRDCERVHTHLKGVGLPVSPRDIAVKWDVKGLMRHCYQDKKAMGGNLTFILAEKIGKTFISHEVTRNALQELLAEALAIG